MKKAFIAYFSASGVTKALSDRLANALGAPLYEIAPEIPYSNADLDWMNPKSRSSLEMKDRSSRPAISGPLPDLSGFDVVFVGFPVWWYREPSIIDTFLESADFSGKTLVPFATSGGSGLGKTADNFRMLAPGANVAEGKRFKAKASEEELRAWASEWL